MAGWNSRGCIGAMQHPLRLVKGRHLRESPLEYERAERQAPRANPSTLHRNGTVSAGLLDVAEEQAKSEHSPYIPVAHVRRLECGRE